jgi:lipopolysaccharide export system permease protein
MKKIIFRKLLLDCLIFFFLALFGISAIIWVFQAVNFLDIMIEDGRNYNVYLGYTLLNFPKILSRIVPFALFFSFTYIIIKYETNNELIIFWNHGVNKIKIINFFFFFSIILMLAQIILLSLIVPKSQEIARSKLRSSDVDYFEGLIKPKKFNDTIKGLTIFAEDKNINDEFKNIYIKKKSSNNKFQITVAKKGVFEFKNNKRILVLYDGQTINSNNGKITNFNFSKSDYGLSNMDSHLVVHKKLQEQPTITLFSCLQTIFKLGNKVILNCDTDNPRDVFKEVFKRIISPLYIPLLILISISLILSSKENVNYSKYKFIVYILGFLVIILSESSLGYIDNNINQNLILILLPVILIFILYFIFIYQLKLGYKKISK